MTNATSLASCGRRYGLFWLGLLALLLCAFYLIRGVLLPFVLGMGTAYFLDPAVDRLERFRLSRGMATSLITGMFFLAIGVCLLFMIPMLAAQVSDFLGSIPGYITQWEREVLPVLDRRLRTISPGLALEFRNNLASSTGVIARAGADFLSGILSSGMAFVNLLSLILITPVVTFYVLRDWDKILAHLDGVVPRRYLPVVREQVTLIHRTLAGFVRGQLNVCFLLGIYYAVLLGLLGLNGGVLIGLATGCFIIIPYLGPLIGMMTGMAVAFFQFGDLTRMSMVLAVFLTGQILEGMVITPKLVGDQVGLHPVWMIFALLAGGALFGFVGVLLAVPVAAVVGVLFRFAKAQYHHSAYFQ